MLNKQRSYFSMLILVGFVLPSFTLVAQTIQSNSLGQSNEDQLLIEVPFVELLSGPGAGYPIINIIEKGEFVTVLLKRTSWIKVEDKRGKQGWFHQDSLLNVSQSGEQVTLTELEFNDYQQRTWEGAVMFGDFNDANFYNISVGYVFTPIITSELSLGKSLGDISDSNIYELQVVSQPFPELTVSPYFSVGLGMITTEPKSILADAKTRENTLVSTAIGGKYYLARNFVLRAEYKYSLVLTDRDENEEIQLWKVGFSVFF